MTSALLAAEINHRMRNFLATVEAVIRQTEADNIQQYRAKLMERLSGVRGFYEIAGIPACESIGLAELLERSVSTGQTARGAALLASGPTIELEPRLALALHLVLHELTMNACKHGALSMPQGSVAVTWRPLQDMPSSGKLAIVWIERGGPQPQPACRHGFGLRLIRQALDGYGKADLEFTPAGAVCRIVVDSGFSASENRQNDAA